MKYKKIFLSMLLIIFISCSYIGIKLWNNGQNGGFQNPAFASNAVKGEVSISEGLNYGKLQLSDALFGICGKVEVNSQNEAQVYFTNYEQNTAWLLLKILAKNQEILGESGVIKPGEYVSNVKLSQSVKAGTEIVLRVLAYEPETYYSKGSINLNTTISEALDDK